MRGPGPIKSFSGLLAMIVGICLLVLASSGCSGRVATGEGWIGEEREEGGVLVVHTLSGSVWSGHARLVEEASIGTADGEEEYLLGRVRGIEVGEDHIYVIDEVVPVVRVYDLEGTHLLDIGREGDGPGEFRRPESLALHPKDGRLFVRDGGSGRINIYKPDGEPDGRWMVRTGWSFGSTPSIFNQEGTLFTPSLLNLGAAVEEWRIGLVGIGPDGATGDTLAPLAYDFREWELIATSEDGNSTSVNNVPFSPQIGWAVGGDGTVVSGVSGTYRIDIQRSDGNRVRIERSYDPVPVLAEEADWYERATIAGMRQTQPGWAWNGPGIPNHKPAFSALIPDLDGRVWVQRPGPGVRQEGGVEDPFEENGWYRNPLWRDAYLYDLFDRDGRYLGEVDVPEGFRSGPRPYIKGDVVVALVEDEEGIPYVKRFRLVEPTAAGNRQE